MNLLRPIAFGIMAVSVSAMAQQSSNENKPAEAHTCPAPESKEGKEAAVEKSLDQALTEFVNKKHDDREKIPNEKLKPFTVSSESSHNDQFEVEMRTGLGLSGKGDSKAIGYPNGSISDIHGAFKGRMNFENGTYAGIFGRFQNYFDNVNNVDQDRTDQSAVAQGAFVGGNSCLGTGISWMASIYNETDNALGMDSRRRSQAAFTDKFRLLGFNWTSQLGLYNEDVEFNSSVGGGGDNVWGLYCKFDGEMPVTEKFSFLGRMSGSFEEADSLNEYTWGAGFKCRALPVVKADLEAMYTRLNRDGAYSQNGDDDMITVDLVWKF
jgi:hypothetical protein